MTSQETVPEKDLDLSEIDRHYSFHPFTALAEHEKHGPPVVMVRGHGVWLEDATGQRYIDGMAGLWCVNVGYGREEIAEAMRRQSDIPVRAVANFCCTAISGRARQRRYLDLSLRKYQSGGHRSCNRRGWWFHWHNKKAYAAWNGSLPGSLLRAGSCGLDGKTKRSPDRRVFVLRTALPAETAANSGHLSGQEGVSGDAGARLERQAQLSQDGMHNQS